MIISAKNIAFAALVVATTFRVSADSASAGLAEMDVVCAAWNTPKELVLRARYVCPSNDARPVLQKAIDEVYDLGVRCVLLKGDYEGRACE